MRQTRAATLAGCAETYGTGCCKFVFIRDRVTTSGRKLRAHSAREIYGLTLRMALGGSSASVEDAALHNVRPLSGRDGARVALGRK